MYENGAADRLISEVGWFHSIRISASGAVIDNKNKRAISRIRRENGVSLSDKYSLGLRSLRIYWLLKYNSISNWTERHIHKGGQCRQRDIFFFFLPRVFLPSLIHSLSRKYNPKSRAERPQGPSETLSLLSRWLHSGGGEGRSGKLYDN